MEVGAIHPSRLHAPLLKVANNVLGRDLQTARAGVPAFEQVTGNELQVRPQLDAIHGLNGRPIGSGLGENQRGGEARPGESGHKETALNDSKSQHSLHITRRALEIVSY